MLKKLEEIKNLLVCPTTHEPFIEISENQLQTKTGKKYQIVDGIPVLIDFEHSVLNESEFMEKNAESVIQRRDSSNIKALIRSFISPTSPKTLTSIKEFILQLKSSNNLNKPKRVLIIGGGSIGKGMGALYEDPLIEIIAFDIYKSVNIQIIADAHNIPFPDESFDGVIIQAVIEHVIDPNQVKKEIYRLLRPGGLLFAETPFMQQVHEGAYDFTRFTESGHRYLFKEFRLISSGVIAGPGTTLVWAIEYFFTGLFRSRKIGKLFKVLFFWVQYLDRVIPEKFASDGASAIYFLGKKEKNQIISESEIIRFYKGAQ